MLYNNKVHDHSSPQGGHAKAVARMKLIEASYQDFRLIAVGFQPPTERREY